MFTLPKDNVVGKTGFRLIECELQPQVRVCPECRAEYSEESESCDQCGVFLCDPEDLERIGRTFGSYEITGIIGVGGMGVVYRATHTTLLKTVAVKVLNERYGQRRDAAREMLREAQAASRIRHPHIVDVTDFGTTQEGAPYFVMEYLEGESLSQLLGRVGRLPAGRSAKIMQQVAGALAAAHKQGIVHRDLKPENIFLLDLTAGDSTQPGDFVKILDFGLAKVLDMGPSSRTRAGMLAGTPWYMSPEQAQNRPVDLRSDVYSVGIVFYQMVTGTVPFNGESPVDILMGHISAAVIQPYKYCRTIDEQTNHVIMRCLEKDPELRFQSMEELSIALERCGTELRLESGDILPEVSRGGGPKAVAQGAPTVTSELVGQVLAPPVSSPTVESGLVERVLSVSQPTLAPLETPPENKRLSVVVEQAREQGAVRPRRLVPLLAGLAVLAVAAAVAVGAVVNRAPEGAERRAPRPVAAKTDPPPPAEVRVTLNGVPAGARVLVDGQPTTEWRPLVLPRSSRSHRVRVEAEGFEPGEVSVKALREAELVFQLKPAMAVARPEKPRRRRRPRRARRRVTKTPAAVKPPPAVAKPEEPAVDKPPPSKIAKIEKPAPKPTDQDKPKPKTKPKPKAKKYRDWVVEPDLE